MEQKTVERFWEKVERGQSGDCWEWRAGLNVSGYGVFTMGKRSFVASRVSWEIANGPIPAGDLVCHHCDNRRCVNPGHLFLGSHRDNYDDSIRKGRQAPLDGHRNPDPNWTEGRPRGEGSGTSKLLDEQVMEIRRRYATGLVRQDTLAAEYGVTQGDIGYIVRGETWKHLPILLRERKRAPNAKRRSCTAQYEAARAKTHCRKGHEYTEQNTYWTKAGTRQCRTCSRINEAARRPGGSRPRDQKRAAKKDIEETQ